MIDGHKHVYRKGGVWRGIKVAMGWNSSAAVEVHQDLLDRSIPPNNPEPSSQPSNVAPEINEAVQFCASGQWSGQCKGGRGYADGNA